MPLNKDVRERVPHFQAPLAHDHSGFRIANSGHEELSKGAEERHGRIIRVDQEPNIHRNPARRRDLYSTKVSRNDINRTETTSVLPTRTWVVDRPTKVEMVRFGPGGTIHNDGEPPFV